MEKIVILLMAVMVCVTAMGKVKEKELAIENGSVKLPGTLCIAGNKKAPIVVFVHGSGPNDRDETIGPNKPFKEIAEGLAKKGISSYRYDKRTMLYKGGADTITFMEETVDDAVAAVKMLNTMGYKRIFVLGHSQGGYCAPLIAQKAEGMIEGVIIMSGNTRNLLDMIDEQLEYIKGVQGLSNDMIDKYKAQMKAQLPKKYIEFDEAYNPGEVIASLKPIKWLVMQGGHDYQVTKVDFDEWKRILGDRAQYYYNEYLDHLMRKQPEMAKPQDYMMAGDVCEDVIMEIITFLK